MPSPLSTHALPCATTSTSRFARALSSVITGAAALSRAAVTGLGRGLLWLLLAVAFGTVEALVHVTEFAAKRFSRRGANNARARAAS